MKKINVIILMLLIVTCRNNDHYVPKNNAWIEDIKYLQTELPTRHINLFANISPEEFNIEIDNLVKNLPYLDKNVIIINLMKIIARIGDSHTGIHSMNNFIGFKIAPVKFQVFDDGVFIVEMADYGQESYLKQKIKAIENIPIENVFDTIANIIPHENNYFVKSSFSIMLRSYEMLKAMGITNDSISYHLNIENGESILVRGSSTVSTNYISCYKSTNTPLYLQNNNLNYWYNLIDDEMVYLQYNVCADMPNNTFLNLTQNLFNDLKDKSINKFIIDLRLNGGGSSEIISPLIEELKKHEELKNKIYVCISCKTFSSGLLNAWQLKEELNAILVGEPTGGKPNHYGDVREFILPNSKLIVRYSTKYFELYPGNDMSTLEPDYYVANNSYDSFAGIDPYFEFIKSL